MRRNRPFARKAQKRLPVQLDELGSLAGIDEVFYSVNSNSDVIHGSINALSAVLVNCTRRLVSGTSAISGLDEFSINFPLLPPTKPPIVLSCSMQVQQNVWGV